MASSLLKDGNTSTSESIGPATAYMIVAATAALPRLIVLAYERSNVLLDPLIVDHNLRFAKVFVASGTFGFTAGMPSANTQPLYGFFLIPLFWLFGGSWLSIGLAQSLVAVVTALLVYKVARRLLPPRWSLASALLATLHPYLVWHDVHAAREVLDELLAAAVVLLALVATERRSVAISGLLGAVAGLAVLGNVRLAFLPIVLAGFLLWRLRPGRRALLGAICLVASSAVVVTPWLVRNRVEVGCFVLNTNGHALWRANNPNTYRTLAAGNWIDDVPDLPPPRDTFRKKGGRFYVDECKQTSFYERQVLNFWRDHPGEKARLAGQAATMLWDPRARLYRVTGPGGVNLRPVSRVTDVTRKWCEGIFMSFVYLLAIVGAVRVRRDFAVLALVLVTYQTSAAIVFAGTTRYRVPWDFLLVLIAASGLSVLTSRAHTNRSAPYAPDSVISDSTSA